MNATDSIAALSKKVDEGFKQVDKRFERMPAEVVQAIIKAKQDGLL